MAISIKSPNEIKAMREGGKILARILNAVGDAAQPGVSTAELDALARKLCEEAGVRPGFLNYRGFPAALCTSVNAGVVHNVPNEKTVLAEGDIISLDFGVVHENLNTDACRTVAVGQISPAAAQLLATTKQALYAGIEQARAGQRIGDISAAVQAVADAQGYGVVRECVGHGIGRRLHEDPEVPNWGTAGRGPLLRTGMTICIEPIINAGAHRIVNDPDGWTTTTADGALSAHFEHTILITEREPIILTPWE